MADAGTALYNLGIVYRRLGRYTDALAHYERAIDIYREIGDRNTEGGAVNNIGIVYLRLGRYDEAQAHFTRALAIHREIGDRTSEAVALTNLGTVAERTGQLGRARAYHEQALARYRRAGYRVGEGDASHGLGVVQARLGDTDGALDHLRHAVAIGRELGEADIETKGLTDLAGVLSEHTRTFISGLSETPSQSTVKLSVVVPPSTNLKYMHGFWMAVLVNVVSNVVLFARVSRWRSCVVSAAISGQAFALSAAVVMSMS